MTRTIPSPLRAALITSTLALGGAEKQFVYIARALQTLGVDVRVFYYGPGGPYVHALTRAGIPVCHVHVPGRPLAILLRLVPRVCRFRPQLVFVGQFGDLAHGGIAGRCARALTVAGVRSNGHYELEAHPRRTRWLMRMPHGLVANSVRARQTLIAAGIPPDRIQVLPNVIDLREFDARALASRSHPAPETFDLAPTVQRASPDWPQSPVVVAIGRLQRCKRFDRFLDALALARRTAPALKGVIIGGDAGEGAALKRHARAWGLWPDHVVFWGESSEVPAWLAHADFLALTSEVEGFPNVLLEAMAAGLPVATTDVGDAAYIVREGETGFVLAPDDAEGMAYRLAQLAQSTALRQSLGQAGRRRVEAHYNFDRLPSRLNSIFGGFARQQEQPWTIVNTSGAIERMFASRERRSNVAVGESPRRGDEPTDMAERTRSRRASDA